MWEKVYKKIDELYDRMVEDRRYLHQYPELSFQEKETSKYICKRYEELGIPYKSNVGGYGVVAKIEGGKPGKTVALRADFDALPIQEENDVPYKSKVDGVMHACGHDGHTATLLSIAEAILPFKDELEGTMVFIHQPAEEYAPGGAKPMIEEGVLEGVDAVFGTHLWADAKLGELEIAIGPFMAGADRFEIKFIGKGGHGASPHQTKDPIIMLGQAIVELQQIVSRRVDPLQPAVLTIGQVEAGNAFNVIPNMAKMTGTVRILSTDVQELIIEEMEKIISGIAKSYDAEYEFDYQKGYPPLINHENEANIYLNEGTQIPGVKIVKNVPPVMGGEDFAYYLMERPGTFFFTGAQIEGHHYPHHHPKFDFDERAMPIAAKALLFGYQKYQDN